MGIVFAALGEYEEALAHYKSALKIDQALGDRAAIALKLGNIGQCYADLGDSSAPRATSARRSRSPSRPATAPPPPTPRSRSARPRSSAATPRARSSCSSAASRWRDREPRALPGDPRARLHGLAQLESGAPPEAALELARSATELARQTLMPIGEIYGLAVQGLALARDRPRRRGRPQLTVEAVPCSARPSSRRAPSRSSTSTPASASWPAGSTTRARPCGDGRTEVERKAARLSDAELRADLSRGQGAAPHRRRLRAPGRAGGRANKVNSNRRQGAGNTNRRWCSGTRPRERLIIRLPAPVPCRCYRHCLFCHVPARARAPQQGASRALFACPRLHEIVTSSIPASRRAPSTRCAMACASRSGRSPLTRRWRSSWRRHSVPRERTRWHVLDRRRRRGRPRATRSGSTTARSTSTVTLRLQDAPGDAADEQDDDAARRPDRPRPAPK